MTRDEAEARVAAEGWAVLPPTAEDAVRVLMEVAAQARLEAIREAADICEYKEGSSDCAATLLEHASRLAEE